MPTSRICLRALAVVLLASGLTATGTTFQVPEPGSVDPAAQGRGGFQPQPVEPMRFRYMGPASSGRIASVAGVPGDKLTYYAGAASGGVWKTTDGGQTFAPIFDDQPVQAIGALALAPSNPTIVWAGTGEAWVIRPTDVIGDGILISLTSGS